MLAKMRGVRGSLRALSLATIAGCAAPRAPAGSQAEARGFLVEDACGEPGCRAIRGHGPARVPVGDRGAIERWRREVLRAIDRPTIGGIAFGDVCRGVGVSVFLRDFRDLDGATARVGALLRDAGRGDQVTICVETASPPPGPRR